MGESEEHEAWAAELNYLLGSDGGYVDAWVAAHDIWQKLYAERSAKLFEAVS